MTRKIIFIIFYMSCIVIFASSCFSPEKRMMFPSQLPMIASSGFEVPNYAVNAAKRKERPKDVFYFEIPPQKLKSFLVYISKYEKNCDGIRGGIISVGQDYINKFEESKILICYRLFVDEDGDGMLSHESLLVSKADEGENTAVFYTFWDE